jgi:uncharacterized protein YcbK (DUF882 family)
MGSEDPAWSPKLDGARLHLSRRSFLRATAACLAWTWGPVPALAASLQPNRTLSFENLHTGEALTIAYARDGVYLADALKRVNHILRDHYSGEVHAIHPGLLDLLHEVQRQTGSCAPYQVISGYRSPQTNEWLRAQGHGVSSRSMHLQGKAIDIRLEDLPSRALRQVALRLRRGGVGFYPRSDFVHLDVGRVRHW